MIKSTDQAHFLILIGAIVAFVASVPIGLVLIVVGLALLLLFVFGYSGRGGWQR